MKKTYLTLFLIGFLPCAIFAADAPFKFRVGCESFANLTYQLDSVTGLRYRNKEDFDALWQKGFLKTDEDRQILAGWKTIRELYTANVDIRSDVKFTLGGRGSNYDLYDRVTIAGLQAKNLDDYLSRLDLIVLPRDREAFARVIRHFEPRFTEWWQREAAQKALAFAAKIQEVLDSESVKANIAKFAAFYEPSLPPNYLITFDLIYRPNLVKAGTSGQAIDNHLLFEFFADESPKQRVAVALHEFCHFLMESRAPEKQLELQNIFLALKRPTAIPAYNLLNEAMASVFGNGVIVRSFAKPESWQKYLAAEMSFYANPNIDRAAKAALPLADEWLAKGGQLTDKAFVEGYVGALEKAFGPSLASPQFLLGESYIFLDSKFSRDILGYERRKIRTSSAYTEISELEKTELTEYFGNPNLNSVFLLTPGSLKSLAAKKVVTAAEASQMEKAYKKDKRLLFTIKRGDNAFAFILVGENDEAIKKLIDELAVMPEVSMKAK